MVKRAAESYHEPRLHVYSHSTLDTQDYALAAVKNHVNRYTCQSLYTLQQPYAEGVPSIQRYMQGTHYTPYLSNACWWFRGSMSPLPSLWPSLLVGSLVNQVVWCGCLQPGWSDILNVFCHIHTLKKHYVQEMPYTQGTPHTQKMYSTPEKGFTHCHLLTWEVHIIQFVKQKHKMHMIAFSLFMVWCSKLCQ